MIALKGHVQLLRRRHARGTVASTRLGEVLAGIDESAERLAALADDLLDVSRIQTGQLALSLATVDLRALVDEAVGLARGRHGAPWHIRVAGPERPVPIAGDAARLEQVLTNLLENAVKYSPDGGDIAVTLRAEGAGVAVAVRDAGIGLPPGAAEAIFAPFGRAANAAASQLPGLGLGLHICRSIVERHGGWIRAASAGEGRGATVTVWLPTAGPPGAG